MDGEKDKEEWLPPPPSLPPLHANSCGGGGGGWGEARAGFNAEPREAYAGGAVVAARAKLIELSVCGGFFAFSALLFRFFH